MQVHQALLFGRSNSVFSAGHRPCAQCRRDKFNKFKSAWVAANLENPPKPPDIGAVDERIHADRITKDGDKVTYEAPAAELPQGTFVAINEIAFLVWRGALLPGSFNGYGPARDELPSSTIVRVLTPASVVRMFAKGLTPRVHPSANVVSQGAMMSQSRSPGT
jgi:hypothetical protein